MKYKYLNIGWKKLKIIIFILFINIFALNHLFSDETIENYSQYDSENGEECTEEATRDERIRGEPLFLGKIGFTLLEYYSINIGLDLAFSKPFYPGGKDWFFWPEHVIGIDYKYQFDKKDSILRLDYTYVPFLFLTLGLSNSYNINKREFGIAPKIGLQIFLLIFGLNIDYRYNFIINNWDKNFYEITFSLSVPLFLLASIFY
jgi:hypothetical protein